MTFNLLMIKDTMMQKIFNLIKKIKLYNQYDMTLASHPFAVGHININKK